MTILAAPFLASLIILYITTTFQSVYATEDIAGSTSSPTPEQLEECKTLKIAWYNCSEKTILGSKCIGMACGTSIPQTNPLLKSDMLLSWAILATIFGGMTSVFYVKSRPKVTNESMENQQR